MTDTVKDSILDATLLTPIFVGLRGSRTDNHCRGYGRGNDGSAERRGNPFRCPVVAGVHDVFAFCGRSPGWAALTSRSNHAAEPSHFF